MFRQTSFNHDIGDWDESKGSAFYHMFLLNKVFNQDIGDWDVSNGRDFVAMFERAEAFNQDLEIGM